MNNSCSSRLISVLMTRAGIGGLPGPTRIKRLKVVATADDLVTRKFHRLALNELWVTDITERPTREGKVYCAAVLDACSRKIIGWAIDSKQDSTLVVNARDMALRSRNSRNPGASSTQITGPSSPLGSSPGRSAQPASCLHPEPSATVSTMR